MPRRAPSHLSPATRRWWVKTAEQWQLEEHHLKLLTLAGEAYDRGREARAVVEREGSYFVDRFKQPRAHPALAVERDSRLSFARLLRELDLDVDPPAAPSRPAQLRRYA